MRKKMVKKFAVLLSISLAAGLCGCGDKKEKTTEKAEETDVSTEATVASVENTEESLTEEFVEEEKSSVLDWTIGEVKQSGGKEANLEHFVFPYRGKVYEFHATELTKLFRAEPCDTLDGNREMAINLCQIIPLSEGDYEYDELGWDYWSDMLEGFHPLLDDYDEVMGRLTFDREVDGVSFYVDEENNREYAAWGDFLFNLQMYTPGEISDVEYERAADIKNLFEEASTETLEQVGTLDDVILGIEWTESACLAVREEPEAYCVIQNNYFGHLWNIWISYNEYSGDSVSFSYRYDNIHDDERFEFDKLDPSNPGTITETGEESHGFPIMRYESASGDYSRYFIETEVCHVMVDGGYSLEEVKVLFDAALQ